MREQLKILVSAVRARVGLVVGDLVHVTFGGELPRRALVARLRSLLLA